MPVLLRSGAAVPTLEDVGAKARPLIGDFVHWAQI